MSTSRRLLRLDRCAGCGELIGLLADDGSWLHTPPVPDPHAAVPSSPVKHRSDPISAEGTETLDRPACPTCRRLMRLRTRRDSRQRFWACYAYPECRSTQPMTAAQHAYLTAGPRISVDSLADLTSADAHWGFGSDDVNSTLDADAGEPAIAGDGVTELLANGRISDALGDVRRGPSPEGAAPDLREGRAAREQLEDLRDFFRTGVRRDSVARPPKYTLRAVRGGYEVHGPHSRPVFRSPNEGAATEFMMRANGEIGGRHRSAQPKPVARPPGLATESSPSSASSELMAKLQPLREDLSHFALRVAPSGQASVSINGQRGRTSATLFVHDSVLRIRVNRWAGLRLDGPGPFPFSGRGPELAALLRAHAQTFDAVSLGTGAEKPAACPRCKGRIETSGLTWSCQMFPICSAFGRVRAVRKIPARRIELRPLSLHPIFKIGNFVHEGSDGAFHTTSVLGTDESGCATCSACGELAQVEFGAERS